VEKKPGQKEIITKMRPDPDFWYLSSRTGDLKGEGPPLASDIRREPGEIPGFYAE